MQDRNLVESMALQSLFRFPRLADELEVKPSDFRDRNRSKLIAALALTVAFAPDGSAPILDASARAQVDEAWVVQNFKASFYSESQGREWVQKLVDLNLREAVQAEVQSLFKVEGDILSDLHDLVARHESEKRLSDEIASMEEIALAFIAERERQLSEGKSGSIPAGMNCLDRWIKGWRPGELTILVGIGGVGKSTLADDLRWRLANQGIYSLLLSGEMTKEQLGERRVHAEMQTPLSYELDDVHGLHLAAERIRTGPSKYMLVDARPRITSARVRSIVRKQKSVQGSLGLVVLDHLRHLEIGGDSDYERVSKGVREIKSLAKELNVPVLALCHFNRSRREEQQRDDGGRPALEMILGSSHVEFEADNILALWRPAPRKESVIHPPTELHILKARQVGQNKKFTLVYDPATQAFEELV